ncbi:hypothetical protein BIV23_31530 [Streptomyces monashensis]|uniref:Uncharacterized protein n=1 Tax=Streptomyces monashensis TaxID=1678012 RepID=A0A1S2PT83_9ACTN|nr:hypothetical protein BIV23_31530 [Streptomyces monashensis]
MVTRSGGAAAVDLACAAGRAHHLTAARTHRIIRITRICRRHGISVLPDRADQLAAYTTGAIPPVDGEYAAM